MKTGRVDLQPWLDCFTMFDRYRQEGLLEMKPQDNDAYVTQPALFAMTDGDDPKEQLVKAMPATLRRLRAYSCFLAQTGAEGLRRPFAVHVVRDEEPRDLLYSFILRRRRRWWWPFTVSDKIDYIDYG